VSFSDPLPRHRRDGTVVMPGHVGTVYQALNFVYTGRSKAHSVTLLPDGSVMRGRAKAKIRAQLTGHRYAERVLEDLGARPMVAGEVPRPRQTASVWLKRHGLQANHRPHDRPGVEQLTADYGRTRSMRKLAAEYGISSAVMRTWLFEAGINPLGTPGRPTVDVDVDDVALSRWAPLTILATPLANSDESDG
jgi:hypothetical protein